MSVSTVPPNPSRPLLSVAAAARACGVSRRTIHRRLAAQAFPAATQTEDGSWQIPVEDLLGAGFHPHAPSVEVPTPARPNDKGAHAPVLGGTPEVGTLRAALTEAEHRATAAEHRATLAEAVATERLRTIDTLSTALRALQPGPAPEKRAAETAEEPPAAAKGQERAERSRWWHRKERSR